MQNFKNILSVRHLRLIEMLGSRLSINRTAEALHTSPSAISRGLREIEELLGARLFDRTTRHVNPTSLGRNLIRHAEQILNQIDRAEADFYALLSGEGDRLDVGLMGGISPRLLSFALNLMKERAPDVAVRFQSNFAPGLVADLIHNRCDLIVTHFDIERIESHELEISQIYMERIVVVAGKDHPLAQRTGVTWEELAQESWAMLPGETSIRRILEHKLLMHKRDRTPIKVETIEVHFVMEMIRSAEMITALPFHIADWMQDGLGIAKEIPVFDDVSPWPVCAATLASREQSFACRTFTDCLRAAGATLMHDSPRFIQSSNIKNQGF